MTHQKKKFWSTEMMVAVASIFVGFCALAITGVQTYIMREQQYASVWPSVSYGTGNSSFNEADSTAHFDFFITNRGVGPAIIEDLKLVYKGRLYDDNQRGQLFREMANTPTYVPFSFASINRNRVVQAGETVNWCQFPPSKEAYRLLKELNRGIEQEDFDVLISYKDIYGNAWLTRKFASETEACDAACRQKFLARYGKGHRPARP